MVEGQEDLLVIGVQLNHHMIRNFSSSRDYLEKNVQKNGYTNYNQNSVENDNQCYNKDCGENLN